MFNKFVCFFSCSAALRRRVVGKRSQLNGKPDIHSQDVATKMNSEGNEPEDPKRGDHYYPD